MLMIYLFFIAHAPRPWIHSLSLSAQAAIQSMTVDEHPVEKIDTMDRLSTIAASDNEIFDTTDSDVLSSSLSPASSRCLTPTPSPRKESSHLSITTLPLPARTVEVQDIEYGEETRKNAKPSNTSVIAGFASPNGTIKFGRNESFNPDSFGNLEVLEGQVPEWGQQLVDNPRLDEKTREERLEYWFPDAGLDKMWGKIENHKDVKGLPGLYRGPFRVPCAEVEALLLQLEEFNNIPNITDEEIKDKMRNYRFRQCFTQKVELKLEEQEKTGKSKKPFCQTYKDHCDSETRRLSNVTKKYENKLIPPCEGCRQWIHYIPRKDENFGTSESGQIKEEIINMIQRKN